MVQTPAARFLGAATKRMRLWPTRHLLDQWKTAASRQNQLASQGAFLLRTERLSSRDDSYFIGCRVVVCNLLHTAQACASDESPISKLHLALAVSGIIYTFDSPSFPQSSRN